MAVERFTIMWLEVSGTKLSMFNECVHVVAPKAILEGEMDVYMYVCDMCISVCRERKRERGMYFITDLLGSSASYKARDLKTGLSHQHGVD